MRISQRRIEAGIKLIAYINSHGMYCKWVSVKWNGTDYEIIETKYAHMNCNKEIRESKQKLRRLNK